MKHEAWSMGNHQLPFFVLYKYSIKYDLILKQQNWFEELIDFWDESFIEQAHWREVCSLIFTYIGVFEFKKGEYSLMYESKV